MTIEEMLAAARARLDRPGPHRSVEMVAAGAILVDTRPGWQRAQEGGIPGALLIERNHLEWRCDPTSDARVPEAVDHDVTWILLCSEGYSSSLAAAAVTAFRQGAPVQTVKFEALKLQQFLFSFAGSGRVLRREEDKEAGSAASCMQREARHSGCYEKRN